MAAGSGQKQQEAGGLRRKRSEAIGSDRSDQKLFHMLGRLGQHYGKVIFLSCLVVGLWYLQAGKEESAGDQFDDICRGDLRFDVPPCDPASNPFCRDLTGKKALLSKVETDFVELSERTYQKGTYLSERVEFPGYRGEYMNLTDLCGIFHGNMDTLGFNGLFHALKKAQGKTAVSMLWRHTLGALGAELAEVRGFDIASLLELANDLSDSSEASHGVLFTYLQYRHKLDSRAQWSYLSELISKFAAAKGGCISEMALFNFLHGFGHSTLFNAMQEVEHARAGNMLVNPCFPHAYSAFTITVPETMAAVARCEAAPSRTYAGACVEGLFHSHIHLGSFLPPRVAYSALSSSANVAVNRQHGYESLSYMCKSLPQDLIAGCTRYYFQERLYLAVSNSHPDVSVDPLSFFQTCAEDGLGCVDGLSFTVFGHFKEDSVSPAAGVFGPTLSWTKCGTASLLDKVMLRGDRGALTCFCSYFTGGRLPGELTEADESKWLACTHGSASSYFGPNQYSILATDPQNKMMMDVSFNNPQTISVRQRAMAKCVLWTDTPTWSEIDPFRRRLLDMCARTLSSWTSKVKDKMEYTYPASDSTMHEK